MFTLKDHARRNIRLAALGAAASIGAIAGITQADTLQWDPTGAATFAAPVGGPGDFNNTDPNFVNAANSHVAATSADDVTFSGIGGAVNVNGTTLFAPTGGNPQTGTAVNSLTLSPTASSYTFTGAVPIVIEAEGTTLSQTTGDNTISSPVAFYANGSSIQNTINTSGGTTLTMSSLTYAGYGWGGLSKAGDGRLVFDGTANLGGALASGQGFNITGGTAMINTSSLVNVGAGGFKVQPGATIGGSQGLFLNGTATSEIFVGGHLAPGTNAVGTNFGTTGTFTFQGAGGGGLTATLNLDTGSELDLDLASTSSYDSVALTKGTYGHLDFIIGTGAIVNINDGVGALTPGTYHIVTMDELGNAIEGTAALSITDGGFVTGAVPLGYSYAFQDVLGSSGQYNGKIIGIDLVVSAAAVPEPMSLGLMGVGAGLMLLRKRRRTH